jgi:hypothetical protein
MDAPQSGEIDDLLRPGMLGSLDVPSGAAFMV